MADGGSPKSERSLKNAASDKPWKHRQKRKATKDSHLDAAQEEDIQIFEGKPAVVPVGVSPTPVGTGYLRIVAEDDAEYVVPSEVVQSFQCVDVILHGDTAFLERMENVIRFPDIRAEVMELVLEFVFLEYLNRMKAERYWGGDTPRLVFQFEVDPGLVMEVIHAAHFLGIQALLKVAATMVAHCFKDVPDVSSMPTDLAWCVAEEFSALDLFDAEERPDFLSLNLDTEKLWEKHCLRYILDLRVRPVSCCDGYPSYREWVLVEGPPPTSWKSLYVSHFLQQHADKQNGDENEAFFKEVSYRGKIAYRHTVRPMFWDWVMSAPGAWPLSSYIAQFPHLRSLSLANIPLHKPSVDGAVPCLSVEGIVLNLPLLQHLDISGTGFTTEAAICLSRSLSSHKSLQVLQLGYNHIKTEGFSAIVRTLPLVRTLKMLDVCGNGISAVVDQSVVSALKQSAIEDFFFAGNCPTNKGENLETVQGSTSGHTQSAGSGPLVRADSCCALMVSVFSEVPMSLLDLQLSQCSLVDCQVAALARALSGHTMIQKLDLSDNRISSPGAISIFSWLQTNRSLKELSLANNQVCDSSASSLSSMLHEHPCIQKVNLKGNYKFSDELIQEVIAGAIAHTNNLNGPFLLDIQNTSINYVIRGRVQRQFPAHADSNLHLLI